MLTFSLLTISLTSSISRMDVAGAGVGANITSLAISDFLGCRLLRRAETSSTAAVYYVYAVCTVPASRRERERDTPRERDRRRASNGERRIDLISAADFGVIIALILASHRSSLVTSRCRGCRREHGSALCWPILSSS